MSTLSASTNYIYSQNDSGDSAYAQPEIELGMSPLRSDLGLISKGRVYSESFFLYNSGDRDLEILVMISPNSLDGTIPIDPDWITVPEEKKIIPSGKTERIDVEISFPENIPEGVYNSSIVAVGEPIYKENESKFLVDLPSISFSLFAYTGSEENIVSAGEIENVQIRVNEKDDSLSENPSLSFDSSFPFLKLTDNENSFDVEISFKNKGNIHISPNFSVYIKNNTGEYVLLRSSKSSDIYTENDQERSGLKFRGKTVLPGESHTFPPLKFYIDERFSFSDQEFFVLSTWSVGGESFADERKEVIRGPFPTSFLVVGGVSILSLLGVFLLLMASIKKMRKFGSSMVLQKNRPDASENDLSKKRRDTGTFLDLKNKNT